MGPFSNARGLIPGPLGGNVNPWGDWARRQQQTNQPTANQPRRKLVLAASVARSLALQLNVAKRLAMAHTSSTAQPTLARFHLPPELLRRICEYLGQLHAPSVLSFALASKSLHSLAKGPPLSTTDLHPHHSREAPQAHAEMHRTPSAPQWIWQRPVSSVGRLSRRPV